MELEDTEDREGVENMSGRGRLYLLDLPAGGRMSLKCGGEPSWLDAHPFRREEIL